ncbi:MAG: mycobacterial-type methylenetetrahydrofolate reductase, partial [Pseudonocardiaceae bacterium]
MSELPSLRVNELVDAVAAYPQLISDPASAEIEQPAGDDRSDAVTLDTIALELVPPNVEDGKERALEEAHKVLTHSKAFGIEGRIGHVMIPGLIEEEDDRPVVMKPKLDV